MTRAEQQQQERTGTVPDSDVGSDMSEADQPLYLGAAKRLGVEQSEWTSGWYVSHSPRNGNQNAEGPWCHWVHLARMILAHDKTAQIMPTEHLPYDGPHIYDEHVPGCNCVAVDGN